MKTQTDDKRVTHATDVAPLVAPAVTSTAGYPKVLADTTGQDRDNKHVHNEAEEEEAKLDGFTRVVTVTKSTPKAPPTLEYPRLTYHKDHGFRTVRSAQEHKEAAGEGWQDKPIPEDASTRTFVSAEDLNARVQLLEVKVATLERNQQGVSPSLPPAQPGPPTPRN